MPISNHINTVFSGRYDHDWSIISNSSGVRHYHYGWTLRGIFLSSYLTYKTSCLTFALQQQIDASARAQNIQPSGADAPQPAATKAQAKRKATIGTKAQLKR